MAASVERVVLWQVRFNALHGEIVGNKLSIDLFLFLWLMPLWLNVITFLFNTKFWLIVNIRQTVKLFCDAIIATFNFLRFMCYGAIMWPLSKLNFRVQIHTWHTSTYNSTFYSSNLVMFTDLITRRNRDDDGSALHADSITTILCFLTFAHSFA